MDDCLRINKPCKFESLAKTWPAYEKWTFNQDNGYEYLADKFKDQQVEVFIDMETDEDNYGS